MGHFNFPMKNVEPINKGYHRVFLPNQLSLGIVVPIETYDQGTKKDLC